MRDQVGCHQLFQQSKFAVYTLLQLHIKSVLTEYLTVKLLIIYYSILILVNTLHYLVDLQRAQPDL